MPIPRAIYIDAPVEIKSPSKRRHKHKDDENNKDGITFIMMKRRLASLKFRLPMIPTANKDDVDNDAISNLTAESRVKHDEYDMIDLIQKHKKANKKGLFNRKDKNADPFDAFIPSAYAA